MKKLLLLLLPALVLFSCGPKTSDAVVANPAPGEVETTAPDENLWKLTAYGAKDALDYVPEDIVITMEMDLAADRVAGKAACNNYFGSLKPSPEGYRISGIGSTKMMCPESRLMEAEEQFLEMLGKVTSYSFRGGQMIMEVDGGRQLVFAR